MKFGTVLKTLLVLGAIGAAGYYAVKSVKIEAVVAKARIDTAFDAVPGTVQVLAEKTMMVRSDLGGRILNSDLKLGQVVSQGEVLAQLDTGDLDLEIEKTEDQFALEKAKMAIESQTFDALRLAEETLKDRKRDFDRPNSSTTMNDVEAASRHVTHLKNAIERERIDRQTQVDIGENKLKELRRRREKLSVVSPIDGVVSKILAYAGDLISPGQPVAEIVSKSRIVEVKVSEENFTGLAIGMPARVKLLGFEGDTLTGKISNILRVADSDTQRYTVHLELDSDATKLDVGRTGEASITLAEHPNALMIPKRAVLNGGALVVKDGVVSKVKLRLGVSSLTTVQVLEGLEAGDLVIVEDIPLYSSGQSVTAVPE